MKTKKIISTPLKKASKNLSKTAIKVNRKSWQLQEAKTHFSNVVKAATEKGPQKITVHGEPTAILISIKEYEKLTKPKLSLYEFMQRSPLAGIDIEFERDKSLTRDINL